MEQKINLKQLEKNTAAVIFQTGILDIGLGLITVVTSMAMLFDDISYYIDILIIVPLVFIVLAFRYIAVPRMGIVKLAASRMRRNLWFMIATTAFLVIMVSLRFIYDGPAGNGPVSGRWIVSGIVFIICATIAYFLHFRRMYLYALLYVGAFNLNEVIRESPGIIPDGAFAYLFVAIVLVIIGCVYLVRFLRKYPVPEKFSYDKKGA